MGITFSQRVHHRQDPVTVGTILGFDERGHATVAWDDGHTLQHSPGDLVPAHGRRKSNPPIVDAPSIQDLEIARRFDPATGSLHMVRDANYRGDDADLPRLDTSEDAYDLLRGMGMLSEEHIVVLMVDADRRVIAWKPTHMGHLDSVEASLRQILTDSFLSGRAKGILLSHNHPSGDPGPSPDDESLTKAVERVGDKLGIRLIDHIVVGRPADHHDEYFSFRDAGLLHEWSPAPDDEELPPPPPPIATDGISDLEFVVDRDPESGSMQPTRDGDYRGDAAEKPVIEGPGDVRRLFPEVSDGASIIALLDTRQQLVGWTAWGDAGHETPERLVRRAVLPPLIMNARSVILLRNTGSDVPSRADDELTEELSSVYGDLDIELFDHVLVADGGRPYSYRDEGRIAEGDSP